MDKNQILKREYLADGWQCREEGEGDEKKYIVSGRAIVFNSPSVVLDEYRNQQLVEVIDPAAVTRELLDASDIILTMFHNREIILGHCNNGAGTLKIARDMNGVNFECELDMHNPDHKKAWSCVQRGDIQHCSFMFQARYYNEDCVQRSSETIDGKIVTTMRVMKIEKIEDFTLTPRPAYRATDCEVKNREVVDSLVDESKDTLRREQEERIASQSREIAALIDKLSTNY